MCCIANIFRMNHWWDPWSQIPRAGHWSRLRYIVTRPSVATSTQFSASLSLSGQSPGSTSQWTLQCVHPWPQWTQYTWHCVSQATEELCHTLHYYITIYHTLHYTLGHTLTCSQEVITRGRPAYCMEKCVFSWTLWLSPGHQRRCVQADCPLVPMVSLNPEPVLSLWKVRASQISLGHRLGSAEGISRGNVM